MNRKLVLLGLIFFIPIMLSGCLWWPGGFVAYNHPYESYYHHYDYDHRHDHSYQQGWGGYRR
jgi:hypothetical protein